jgi:hypothetical protein
MELCPVIISGRVSFVGFIVTYYANVKANYMLGVTNVQPAAQ